VSFQLFFVVIILPVELFCIPLRFDASDRHRQVDSTQIDGAMNLQGSDLGFEALSQRIWRSKMHLFLIGSGRSDLAHAMQYAHSGSPGNKLACSATDTTYYY
jgi:hypothetical protein